MTMVTSPLLDTYRPLETPEGVELGLRVAGPVIRAQAWFIDLVLRGGIYLAFAVPLAMLEEFGVGLILILVFLCEWIYPVLFEVLQNGATPGKRVFGLKAVHDDGTPVGWSASFLRNLLRAADMLPIAYLFGLVTMLIRADFKRLGDLVAGTLVIYSEDEMDHTSIPSDTPVATPIALTLEEQQSLISFAERSPQWTPERAEELAQILDPLTGTTGSGSVARLRGMAQWLVGRR